MPKTICNLCGRDLTDSCRVLGETGAKQAHLEAHRRENLLDLLTEVGSLRSDTRVPFEIRNRLEDLIIKYREKPTYREHE